MTIPIAHIVLDIVANIAFGAYLYSTQQKCSCGGDDCHALQTWAYVVSIVLFVYAGFHIIIILNDCFGRCLNKIPIIKDILEKIRDNWTDIYVISMICVWAWILYVIIRYHSVFNCKRDLVLASEIYVVFSVAIAILYGLQRDKITSFHI